MASTNPKIVLSRSQDIPFNKLVLSQANVRRVKAGVSIEELAEDIARRGLLQGLTVRAAVGAEGAETGMFEVPAGGRRYRALELLVKQKRMAKNQPVPCVVRTEGLAVEDSLAENLQRVALHPLDQFRAFQTLRDSGLGEEEIAARFFVSPAVVKQRLKLASVSPKLLDLYADDQMTLEQLMAFTVTSDHTRQEQAWVALARSFSKEPYSIRRLLTESAVRAADKRARFIGIAAYEAAGGAVMRDLFQQDDGGWLQDPALLDRLVAERLQASATAIADEGWKWVEVAAEFSYGHASGLLCLVGKSSLTDEERASQQALRAEFEKLEAEYAEADELPDAVDQRLGEIESVLEALDARPASYDPADIARAGVFVSIDADGELCVERGYVRREDEPPVHVEPEAESEAPEKTEGERPVQRAVITVGGGAPSPAAPPAEEEDGIKPLAERLVTELTAHRTLALRDAVANDPDTAFLAVLHALCLKAFYRSLSESCLEIEARSSSFGTQAPGLNDTPSAKAIDARQQNWLRQLPTEVANLWDALIGLDADGRAALFAHCASLSLNAVHDPWNRRPRGIAHADRLALAVNLDMAVAGWTPTVDNYLGRVTKARILEAVREGKGEAPAQLIDHLKKPDMAKEAERLLAGTGWLPEPLRTPAAETTAAENAAVTDAASLPAFLSEQGDGQPVSPEAAVIAAE
jgi:ParB family transcriptional regulator, chromosome partitioning protein